MANGKDHSGREQEGEGRPNHQVNHGLNLNTVGTNCKNPPKNRQKKIVKLIHHNIAHNSLTNFEYEAMKLAGNGNYENLLKLIEWKNTLIYFWRILVI